MGQADPGPEARARVPVAADQVALAVGRAVVERAEEAPAVAEVSSR